MTGELVATLQIKRIYEDPEPADGFRVLVDRLWPRGISKERAALDLWLKDIAPSTQARTDFGHKAENFEEFTVRYRSELDANDAVHAALDLLNNHKVVTLLIAAKDPVINHGQVLRDYLLEAQQQGAQDQRK
jgi:uncharacterized protein YeaO (DUF488 family)